LPSGYDDAAFQPGVLAVGRTLGKLITAPWGLA
jgi:hypothetical protein